MGTRDAQQPKSGVVILRVTTGEPHALKGASSVRGGAVGKGPQGTSLAAYSTHRRIAATVRKARYFSARFS